MFVFENLDEKTRSCMVAAIDQAEKTNNIYFSRRFNVLGNQKWVSLLREAAQLYNEHWLAFQIEAQVLMKEFEGSSTPSGGYITKHVPNTSSETLSEGQFNSFYIIGLCMRAKSEGKSQVIVYRAKNRKDPRPESEAIIGTAQSVEQLISELQDVNISLKNPLLQPNSGLSVKLQ